jgi:hypothetical protein
MVAACVLAHRCGVGAGRCERGRLAVQPAACSCSGRLAQATHRRAALGPYRRVHVRAAPSLHCSGTNARHSTASQVRGGCASRAVVLDGWCPCRRCTRLGRDRKLRPRSHARPPGHPAAANQAVCAAPTPVQPPPGRTLPSARVGRDCDCRRFGSRRCRRADPLAGAQPRPAPMGRAVNLRGVGMLALLVPAVLLAALGAHAGAQGELLQHEAMVRPRCAACAVDSAIGCGSRARASCARSGNSAASPTQAHLPAPHAAVGDRVRTKNHI